MYEDCIEKFSCNRYPNGCSEECYLTLGCPEINPSDRIVEGPAGRDGLNGKDLEFQWIYTDTEIRLAVRVKGTEQWFYSPSLIGPQGEQGKQGKQGERGPQGIQGFRGAPGLNGKDGVSPIIETIENASGFRVEITDAEGTKKLQLKHGISPDVVTSEDEEGFNVEITDSQGKESFKLKHGISSEIDVEDTSGGHKVIITDKNGTKEILLTDGKDAVSPIVSMNKENGIITIRVEDAEGVKEESVKEGITEHNVPEFIGTLENPVDFSDLFETIASDRYHTGFCILGGYFKVTDWDKNDLGVKHWQEIFPTSSGVILHYLDTILVTYTYRNTPLSALDSQIEFTFIVGDTLYNLYGFVSHGIIDEYGSSKIVFSSELNNYYKKTETYSKKETDTKISEVVANGLTDYYKKAETYSKEETKAEISGTVTNALTDYYKKTETYTRGETETKIAEAVAELGKLDIEVVDSLPANAETNKIYLVAQDRVNPDVYDEYLYINNAWERIGTTAMSIGTQILNLVGTEDNPVDFQELFNAVERGGSFYLSGYVKCDDNGTSVVKHLSELLTYGTWYDAKYLCNYLIFDQDPKFGYISLIEAMGSNKPRYYRFAICEEANSPFNNHRQGISLEESSIVACELVRDRDLREYVDSALGDVEELLKEV
jgi:hypothetical protein